MKKVSLVRKNGALKIDIDGQLFEPLSFKSFRPTKENISDFSKAGVKLFSILSSGMISMLGVEYSLFGESWIGDHEYDFNVIDAQIELFRQNAPDSYFALMIQLDTRPWYTEKYGVPYTFTHLSQTIAQEKWRNDATDYMKAVLEHVEAKYGDIFYGYFLMCGFTTEWMSQFDEEASSDIKEEAYKKYLNMPDAKIPSKEMLDGVDGQAFVSPEYMGEVKNYRKFHAELISDSILYFAHEAQKVLKHKKLLGLYFGYLFELEGARLWNAGHLAYEKVFTSPDINMISSPSSYAYRAVDSTSAFMLTYDTLDFHNKLYYLEFDHITHLSPAKVADVLIPGGHNKLKDQTETLNVMQRDFMLCLAHGAALWWFDMFNGWFASKEMMESIAQMISIQKQLSNYPQKSVSEILVIASGEALYGVNKNSGLNLACLSKQRGGLARMGAPYDVYSMCDISNVDMDKYKLVIFLDAFEMNTPLRTFAEQLKISGKTVLWIYAPDYVSGGISAMQSITDINIVQLIGEEDSVDTHEGKLVYDKLPQPRFFIEDNDVMPLGVYPNTEKVAIGMKRFSDYTSIYSAVGNLSGAVLRNIARLAGVHIYCDDDAACVYVNSKVIGVYALEDTTVSVPDGTYKNMFNGETFKTENGKLFIPAGQYASKLLVME